MKTKKQIQVCALCPSEVEESRWCEGCASFICEECDSGEGLPAEHEQSIHGPPKDDGQISFLDILNENDDYELYDYGLYDNNDSDYDYDYELRDDSDGDNDVVRAFDRSPYESDPLTDLVNPDPKKSIKVDSL